ncbi:MAG: ABC transporter permease [Thermoleophilia bacterium]|jgi:putative ABC transport system permease protein
MNLWESVRMAFTALAANKGRSALTILGVVIGVGAVIGMVAVGQGARQEVLGSVEGLGSNLIFAASAGDVPGSDPLTLTDAEAVAELPGVARIAPEVGGPVTVSFRGETSSSSLSGVTPEFAQVRKLNVALGRFISASDVDRSARVAVLGLATADDLGTRDLLGKKIDVAGVAFTVIGLLEPKGRAGPVDPDQTVLVPINTAATRLTGSDRLSGLSVEVADPDRMDEVSKAMTRLLRGRHEIPDGAPDDFFVTTQVDILDAVGTITTVLTALLGGIAGISLVVGGIGIMNIMLVSVTERTREIGIRKAIGARRWDILAQFLVESVALSLFGGGVGILVGFLMAVGAEPLLGFPGVVTPSAVVLAFAVSAAIGIFFGVYPAWKASRQDPIEALRYE